MATKRGKWPGLDISSCPEKVPIDHNLTHILNIEAYKKASSMLRHGWVVKFIFSCNSDNGIQKSEFHVEAGCLKISANSSKSISLQPDCFESLNETMHLDPSVRVNVREAEHKVWQQKEESGQFLVATVKDILCNKTNTVSWIERSGIDYSYYHPLLALKLVMILSLMCLQVPADCSRTLLDLLTGSNNIAYLLPWKFKSSLLTRRKGCYLNLDPDMVAEAFMSVEDPLMIGSSVNPSINAPCAIFVDLTRSREEIMSDLFPNLHLNPMDGCEVRVFYVNEITCDLFSLYDPSYYVYEQYFINLLARARMIKMAFMLGKVQVFYCLCTYCCSYMIKTAHWLISDVKVFWFVFGVEIDGYGCDLIGCFMIMVLFGNKDLLPRQFNGSIYGQHKLRNQFWKMVAYKWEKDLFVVNAASSKFVLFIECSFNTVEDVCVTMNINAARKFMLLEEFWLLKDLGHNIFLLLGFIEEMITKTIDHYKEPTQLKIQEMVNILFRGSLLITCLIIYMHHLRRSVYKLLIYGRLLLDNDKKGKKITEIKICSLLEVGTQFIAQITRVGTDGVRVSVPRVIANGGDSFGSQMLVNGVADNIGGLVSQGMVDDVMANGFRESISQGIGRESVSQGMGSGLMANGVSESVLQGVVNGVGFDGVRGNGFSEGMINGGSGLMANDVSESVSQGVVNGVGVNSVRGNSVSEGMINGARASGVRRSFREFVSEFLADGSSLSVGQAADVSATEIDKDHLLACFNQEVRENLARLRVYRSLANGLRVDVQKRRQCITGLEALVSKRFLIAELPRIDELRRAASSSEWENMFMLYCRRAIVEDEMLAWDINDEYVPDKMAEFLKETQKVIASLSVVASAATSDAATLATIAWLPPMVSELRSTSKSANWEPMFVLYSRRSAGEDYRLAREINRVLMEVNGVVMAKDQFIEELDSLGTRHVPSKMAEFLREIQRSDKVTVAKLQILVREMELNAHKKDLFIQKLDGLIPY
nr:UvrD-like helicase, ATP-binding domain, P-loop containing nucleoside triphosphate hydrolase [Tanacetum cinerariifolium]